MTAQTKRSRSNSREQDTAKVHEEAAIRALAAAESPQYAWSRYIIEHWRLTGDLAPGCDMKHFLAWANEFTRAAACARLGQSTEGLYPIGSIVVVRIEPDRQLTGVITDVCRGDLLLYIVQCEQIGEQMIAAHELRLAHPRSDQELAQC